MVAALALAGSAQGANQPHPTLDAIASEVAGYPASVWCETDETAWAGMSATGASGFVRRTATGHEPVAYIGPSACTPLTEALRDSYAVSTVDLAHGLLTVLHESVHLRGVHDEGETDCTALALVKTYAVRSFGYSEWTTVKRRVHRWVHVQRKVWVKRDGRRARVTRLVRVRVARTVKVRVPDVGLASLVAAAELEHLRKSPEYQGDC